MTLDEDAFSGTRPVDDRQRFDVAAVEAWMRRNVEDFSGPVIVSQFQGGQSNPTFLLSAGPQRWVLRRKPAGALVSSAHAVDREYRIMKALAESGVPVAAVKGLCLDEGVIGSAFYVMEYLEGRIFWQPSLPGCTPAERAAMYDEMVRVVAKLHTLNPEDVGLADYGKPGNYFRRQVERWTRQYIASPAPRIEAMDRLVEILPGRIPADDETALVHGDFRVDNLIFHPTEPRILAVLDWELSTLGDPLADFAYHCLPWHLPPTAGRSLREVDLAALGIPCGERYIASYRRETGRSAIDPARWTFCVAFSLFRIASILQGIRGRIALGTAASARAEEISRAAPIMADLALDQILTLESGA